MKSFDIIVPGCDLRFGDVVGDQLVLNQLQQLFDRLAVGFGERVLADGFEDAAEAVFDFVFGNVLAASCARSSSTGLKRKPAACDTPQSVNHSIGIEPPIWAGEKLRLYMLPLTTSCGAHNTIRLVSCANKSLRPFPG
jgi:hypothetical protein